MAIVQSAATGNANAGATWVGGVAPGTGDTFEVLTGHTVTFTANMTVLGWTQKGSGRLMLNAGVVLTATASDMIVEGDSNDVAKVVLAAGAQLMANPATGVTVTLRIGTDLYRYAEVEARGTSGSRCKIGKTGGAAGSFDIRHGDGQIWMNGLLDCEYTDIQVGTIELYPRNHGKLILKNCDVAGGFTVSGYNLSEPGNTGLLQFEDTVFHDGVNLQSLNTRTDITIKRCEFFASISITGGPGPDSMLTFHDSVLNNNNISGSWDGPNELKGLFLYGRYDAGVDTRYVFVGKYIDCYAYADFDNHPDQVGGGNPHFFGMSADGKTMRIEGCVFEYRGPTGGDTGDIIDLNNGTAELVRSIVLPANTESNLSGYSSGVCWFLGGSGMLDIDHCTFYSAGAAVQFPHNVSMGPNQARVRNSLFWTDHSDIETYAVFNDSPGTSAVDAMPPGNFVGNAMYGMSDGTNVVNGVSNTTINGLKDLELSAVPTGNSSFPARGHQMTDTLVGICKWGRYRGLGSNGETNDVIVAAAIAQLRADKTLARTSLIPFVRNGFTPGNAALSTMAADGTTPGFANVAAPMAWTTWPDSLAAWHARNQPKTLIQAQYLIDLATTVQGGGGDGNEVAATYYDGQRVYQNLALEYPADATLYLNAAEACYYLYVTRYLIPGGYGAPGHWNFTTGLKMMFDRLGTQKYKDAVFGLSLNAAFAADGVVNINGDIDIVRENAYALMSHLNARLLGQAPRAITDVRIEDLWLQSQAVLDGVLTQPGDQVSTFGGGTLQTFMVAIMVEAFHMVYDDSTDPTERADIVARCQAVLDHTWEDRWRPQSGWFWYGTDDTWDLNLYIAPAYAWVWHKTGNVRNRDRYDVMFSIGANQGWLDGQKQFNQQNIKTREGIHYRTIAVNTSTEVEGPEEVSTYTLVGPASASVGQASTNFTVTLGTGTVTGTIRFTPQASGGTGTFNPTFLDLTDSVRTGTFTYTPTSSGVRTITAPDNGSLTDPLGVTFDGVVVVSPVSTYTLTGPVSGYINNVSGTFTVTLGSGDVTGTIRFTPQASGGTGVFVPTFLDLTNGTRSGTFTYIPSSLGSRVITSPDNSGLTDPGGIAFEAVAQPVEPPSPNQEAPFIPGDSVVMIGGVGGERTLIIPWDGKK